MDNWIMLALAACGATTIMRAICRLDNPDKKKTALGWHPRAAGDGHTSDPLTWTPLVYQTSQLFARG